MKRRQSTKSETLINLNTTNLSNDSHHIYVTNSPIELHKITSTLRLLLIICYKLVLLISTYRQWILYRPKCCGFRQEDFVHFMDFVDFDI